MYYSGFPEKITRKWKILLEGWPLNTFSSLLQLMTKNEVEVLYNAWKTGTVKFHRLSDDEWKEWDVAWFQSVLGMMMDVDNAEEEQGEDEDVEEDGRSQHDEDDMNGTTTLSAGNDDTPSSSSTICTSASLHVPSLSITSDATGNTPRKGHHSKATHRMVQVAISTFTGTDLQVLKKSCKPWLDKGKKRGPHGSNKDKENR